MLKGASVEIVGASIAVGASLLFSLYIHNKNTLLQERLETVLKGYSIKSLVTFTDDECSQDGVESDHTDSNHKMKSQTNPGGGENITQDDEEMVFRMKEIGIITSPYPQRAGTPRQGLLAPHSRSHLTLHSFIPKETLDDLDQYSHVWIIFQFHLNPIGKGKDSKAKRQSTLQNQEKVKQDARHHFSFTASKIKPPRAGGKKVGVLATRSPHRPNNVGLSLAKVEGISTIETGKHWSRNGGRKPKKQTILKLLGLDLVDGTPVYDIKPYLPSDRVGDIVFDNAKVNSPDENIKNESDLDDSHIIVPPWVTGDDKLSSVSWSIDAQESVQRQREIGALHPLYPPIKVDPTSSDWKDDEVCLAISEIIAQDPRAQHDKRGLITDADKMYEITFGTLRVGFIVEKAIEIDSEGGDNNVNGMDEKKHAVVIDVWPDPGDFTAIEGSYQHNLALRRREEEKGRKIGKILKWTNPVREGVTRGLCDHTLEYHASMEESGTE